MPPKATTAAARGRPKGSTSANRPRGGGGRAKETSRAAPPSDDEGSEASNPFASSDMEEDEGEGNDRGGEASRGRAGREEEVEPDKTIPRDLLTRLLHEMFTKDATRISKDANAAAGKYMDVFVREAIARTAVEKRGGFLEVLLLISTSSCWLAPREVLLTWLSRFLQVDDLEKVTPQLLLDL